jgi:hypothetical protein
MPPRATNVAEKEHIRRYPVDSLALDRLNPRITVADTAKETDIIRLMYETQALDELALSFAENGYFLEEPVVVVPAGSGKTSHTVVEGNRRVATLKLLLSDKLKKRIGVSNWPVLSEEQAAELSSVPAVLYESRDEVVPYLGYRHISGIKTWDPFAKARYVAQLVNRGRTIPDIERSVGDRTNAVRRLYQSYVIYQQITTDLGIPAKVLENTYSLLEVILSQVPIKRLLGMPQRLPTGRVDLIVPEGKLDNLREVVSWVFGDPDNRQQRIITDSRQIHQRLAPVIADPDALEFLRKTRDLEGAYENSGGELKVLLKQFAAVRRATQRALGYLPSHQQEPEVQEALRNLKPLLDTLVEGLKE